MVFMYENININSQRNKISIQSNLKESLLYLD